MTTQWTLSHAYAYLSSPFPRYRPPSCSGSWGTSHCSLSSEWWCFQSQTIAGKRNHDSGPIKTVHRQWVEKSYCRLGSGWRNHTVVWEWGEKSYCCLGVGGEIILSFGQCGEKSCCRLGVGGEIIVEVGLASQTIKLKKINSLLGNITLILGAHTPL